ncbi:hypothetical protein PR202_gb16026 [Eleusine coracana subsp. coracana]|uniref:Uncharacterized protein n=1 Tax=Eleusine coracana subsp. coracana TaxID=191504 RepID=A0AAV5EX63_ELECO|nr:hypothetical protein PR202_gb16026 [Eleusine coracana subsp. coracana]
MPQAAASRTGLPHTTGSHTMHAADSAPHSQSSMLLPTRSVVVAAVGRRVERRCGRRGRGGVRPRKERVRMGAGRMTGLIRRKWCSDVLCGLCSWLLLRWILLCSLSLCRLSIQLLKETKLECPAIYELNECEGETNNADTEKADKGESCAEEKVCLAPPVGKTPESDSPLDYAIISVVNGPG